MDTRLKKYISTARDKKFTDDQIKAALLESDWPEEQIDLAFAQQNNDLPLPPAPPQIAHIGMWIGFLYIIFFISLYVLATSIGLLMHDWVNTQKPNPSDIYNYYTNNRSYIRGLLSSIIVSCHLYIV